MENLKVQPVSEIGRLESQPKSQKATKETKASPSFSEVLQQVMQSELASKVASNTSLASVPSNIQASNFSKPNLHASNLRLNGDYLSSLKLENPTENDKTAKPQGNARASLLAKDKTIDKTSKLYEQSLELESFFVKILIDSMKNTLHGGLLGEESYASKMYRDMMFEELSRTMTKNAGFGLADQIYLELNS